MNPNLTKIDPEEAAEAIADSIRAVEDSGAPPQLVELSKTGSAVKALFLLSTGVPIEDIHRRTKLSRNAIRGLQERHTEVVAELRKKSATLIAISEVTALEVLALKMLDLKDSKELRDKVSPKDIAITAGIAVEKSLLIQGKATEILQVNVNVSLDEAQDEIRKANQQAVIDVEVVE
jgi:hypothetical protein